MTDSVLGGNTSGGLTTINPAVLNRDYALLIDRSGSMRSVDAGNSKSRWDQVKETSIGIAAKLTELNPEGIFFQLFSSKPVSYAHAKPADVEHAFNTTEPGGSTALHLALAEKLDDYLSRKAQGKTKANGEAIFVVTDGEPDDQAKVAQVIVNTTKRLTNPDELNITFVQVGHDTTATAYLKRLDDDLENEGAKYDIVDTITVEDIGAKNLTQVIIDAVTEHKQH